MSKFTKQKLNTRSSTEAELMRCSDHATSAIFAKLFLEAQEYIIEQTNIHQDNKSAIKLKRNDKTSSSQHTSRINIRYFSLKDRIKDYFDIVYCPTEIMVTDFYQTSVRTFVQSNTQRDNWRN